MERWSVRRRTKCASEPGAELALLHDAQELGPHRLPPLCGFTHCPERGVIVRVIPPVTPAARHAANREAQRRVVRRHTRYLLLPAARPLMVIR
jgi:hypothetical protein